MDWIVPFILDNAEYAHWLVFGLLMLAGLNFPISEDLLLALSGFLAATVIPEHTVQLFVFAFLGAYLSDWVAYGIGRFVGPSLWGFRWIRKVAPRKKVRQVEGFYQRYGIWTLLIGRLIPFGVRNVLFMSAGVAKMPFSRFALSDVVPCLLTNSLLFWAAYSCGQEFEEACCSAHGIYLPLFAILGVVAFLAASVWMGRTVVKSLS